MEKRKTPGAIAIDERDDIKRGIKSEFLHIILYTAASFALSTVSLRGEISPFALAFAAAAPHSPLFSGVGAIIGYLLFGGQLRYAYAAVMLIVVAAKLVLSGLKQPDNAWIIPVFSTVLIVGVRCFVSFGGGFTVYLAAFFEGAMTLALSSFYTMLHNKDNFRDKPVLFWAHISAALPFILILCKIEVVQISFARIVAVFTVMLAAHFSGSSIGAATGILYGFFIDIMAVTGGFFAPLYGFAGLCGGAASKKGRFACAVFFVTANCLGTLWGSGSPYAMPGLFECLAASFAFVMLSDKTINLFSVLRMEKEFTPDTSRQRMSLSASLKAVSNAVGELGASMSGGQSKVNSNNIGTVYDRAADRICRRCPSASACWDKSYAETKDAMNHTTKILKTKNYLQTSDFPQPFSSRCNSLRQFTGAVNEEYRSLLRRRAADMRSTETAQLMQKQYTGIENALADIAESVDTGMEYYPALERRLKPVLRSFTKAGRLSVYSFKGRMHVELYAASAEDAFSDQQAFSENLAQILEKNFEAPRIIPAKGRVIVRFSEQRTYDVSVHCCIRKKEGELVSGDAGLEFETDDGRKIVLLSDGMGTGEAAGKVSQQALKLISGFIRSGCGLLESTKAVMPVLTARFEHSGFVALDMLEINMFSGKALFLKCGSPPSFLIRGQKIGKIQSESLPAGLESPSEEDYSPFVTHVEHKDRIVMVSDGVWENEDMDRVLRENIRKKPSELAQVLMSAASGSGAVDDMSVIIVTVTGGN